MFCVSCQTTLTSDQNFCHQCGEKVKKQENNIKIVNSLTHIGTLDDFDKIILKYPLTEYEFYATYNTKTPTPIEVSMWNRGIRVYYRNFVPHDDDSFRKCNVYKRYR